MVAIMSELLLKVAPIDNKSKQVYHIIIIIISLFICNPSHHTNTLTQYTQSAMDDVNTFELEPSTAVSRVYSWAKSVRNAPAEIAS